jgi:hypothetical protein
MSKTPISTTELGLPPAVIAHTFIRLRGKQHGNITVLQAGTSSVRVNLAWGGILWSFRNAAAAAGVLEGIAAAKATLMHVPLEAPPAPQEGYDRPTIAIEWTDRPSYAVMSREVLSHDRRRTLRWTDVYLGPLTIQVLDRIAYHSAIEVLQLAHSIAVGVCEDGPRYRADPTADDYRAPR